MFKLVNQNRKLIEGNYGTTGGKRKREEYSALLGNWVK
jgi:hypothetical protein